MVEEAEVGPWRKWTRRAVKALVVISVLLLVAAVAFYPQKWEKLTELLLWVQLHPIKGFLIFLILYIGCTVAFVPVTLLSIAAGAVFGMWVGATLVWLGALVGETLAFLIGRFLLRGWVKKTARKHQVWRALEQALKEEGWKVVLLLRMAPILPFALLNYAMGSSAVKFPSFFVASSLGVIPGICMHVYLGTLVKDISTIHSASSTPPIARLVVLIVSLVSCVVALVSSTLVARHALLQRLRAIEESDLNHQLLNDEHAPDCDNVQCEDAPITRPPAARLWPFPLRRAKSLGDDAGDGGLSELDQCGVVGMSREEGGSGVCGNGGSGHSCEKEFDKGVSEESAGSDLDSAHSHAHPASTHAGVGGQPASAGWPVTQPPLDGGQWWPERPSAASDPEAEELTPLSATSAGSTVHGAAAAAGTAARGTPRAGGKQAAVSGAHDTDAGATDVPGAADSTGSVGSSGGSSNTLVSSGSWPPARELGLLHGSAPGVPT